jgi:glutamate carboxypeptidase
VAPEAGALVDVRVPTDADAVRVERAIRGLQPVLKGTSLSIAGGIGRRPMPATPRNQALCRRAQDLGRGLELELGEASLVGGGSDANLTSALTATLDGLGPVGDGAHAEDEHVLVSALPERAALLALLLLEPPLPAARPGGRRASPTPAHR